MKSWKVSFDLTATGYLQTQLWHITILQLAESLPHPGPGKRECTAFVLLTMNHPSPPLHLLLFVLFPCSRCFNESLLLLSFEALSQAINIQQKPIKKLACVRRNSFQNNVHQPSALFFFLFESIFNYVTFCLHLQMWLLHKTSLCSECFGLYFWERWSSFESFWELKWLQSAHNSGRGAPKETCHLIFSRGKIMSHDDSHQWCLVPFGNTNYTATLTQSDESVCDHGCVWLSEKYFFFARPCILFWLWYLHIEYHQRGTLSSRIVAF